jgi:CBS domain-containing protein
MISLVNIQIRNWHHFRFKSYETRIMRLIDRMKPCNKYLEDSMKAMQAMTRNVVCIHEDDSLEVARDIMKEWDIRHLPVVRDKKLVGILSDRDVLLFTSAVNTSSAVEDRSVFETMTKRPITCSSEDSIAHIAGLMIENKVDCIPVVEPEDNELIGLITTTDLIELLRERDILDASRTVPWGYAVRVVGQQHPGYL